jgi:UDP-glucose 4-epimerase
LVAGLRHAGADLLLLGPPPLKRSPHLVEGRQVRFAADALDAPVERLARILTGCDSLLHLGYRPPLPGTFWSELDQEIERNVAPTVRLLDAAARAGIEFLGFASSTSVYLPASEAVDEKGTVGGRTPYAMGKLMQEDCIRQWGTRQRRPVGILRLATVYGPGETVARAVPNFIRAVLAGQAPVVDGQGTQPSDLIYVSDVVEAFIVATRRKADGVFNIGSGLPRTPRQIAAAVITLCQARVPVGSDPGRAERPGAICLVARAAAELEFRARTSLGAGLQEEIAWMRGQLALEAAPR